MRVGASTGLSHAGRKRRHNEDSYVIEPPLFAVADGMGGAKAGEVASGLAAAALKEPGEDGASGEERVAALIREANRRVFRRAAEDQEAAGMGTTMTVALVESDRVAIGHVGDSRAYLVRDGRLEQLTDDHSLVAELVRSGRLTPEEAEIHPQRSVITRAVGTEPDVDVDTFSVQGNAGDLFLICSDGLTDMVDEGTILQAVEGNRGDLDEAAKVLVGAANRGGGEDNITVVVFELSGDEPVEDTAITEQAPVIESETTEDEDTLTGLEAVPVQPAEEQPRRRGRALPIASGLAVLLIAAAAVLWLLDNL
ncbi:MAG TPA: Stp1/IreP family PP2C-type Ser/Thr phosphatase [Gaiellaceae bacterium]|nr:Stp1/IreP family PP2C-type Ser/Thr phosphatase [Gaiellaceae bacterium]